MIRRKSCLSVLLAFVVAALALYACRTWLLRWLGAALVENDGPRKADAIVVLGGDEYGSRTLTAGDLALKGFAPYVVVSGPQALLGPESDADIEFARRHGYPVSLFRSVPNQSKSTREEVGFLGQYLKQLGVRTILLVTSNYHTRRAARLMRLENPWMRTYVCAAPDRGFSPDNWWQSRTGLKTFLLEETKTITAWFGA